MWAYPALIVPIAANDLSELMTSHLMRWPGKTNAKIRDIAVIEDPGSAGRDHDFESIDETSRHAAGCSSIWSYRWSLSSFSQI
jgi:hypothetical protein